MRSVLRGRDVAETESGAMAAIAYFSIAPREGLAARSRRQFRLGAPERRLTANDKESSGEVPGASLVHVPAADVYISSDLPEEASKR